MDSIRDFEAANERFGRAIALLDAGLDWEFLGELYCHDGGESFFPPEQRDQLFDAGLRFAADLGELLAPAAGSSLYFGAALFELLPILFECLILDREVTVRNLDCEEARQLNRALAGIDRELGTRLPRIDTNAAPFPSAARFDHVWMTSVLNDPEAFPALHDRLYGRAGTELSARASERADEASEAARAAAIVRGLLGEAAHGALFTTTDEELPIVEEVCVAVGREIVVPDQARLSGIVGDPVRHCRLDREMSPRNHAETRGPRPR